MLAPPPPNYLALLRKARLLALLVPGGLLGGALFSQYVGGLHPCEMCYWQRWPHAAAMVMAIWALLSPAATGRARMLVLGAALAIALSGAIGVFHAGVEAGLWEGVTSCTATAASSLDDILNTPLIRCDQVPWSFLGISMAGWNAILSLGGATMIGWLALRRAT
ncbi:disulfide bond formation protein B [Sphingomonas xanthus]|uniref:Disulfide bond formation protein B n=1 Tax=Sphingomonas xanthus TaxID=2594473 RepID=A0A516IQS7_9SPHN|nr:disulfide bond formation protein B [Sphingomonas xanthus]QDP19251.1 disulfide bond formation protein B [Sphingomonas xanthus]